MDLAAISVIIPALDEVEWIAAAVASALTAVGTECIVVDGGSRDRTCERARAAGARIASAVAGRASQMNAGARLASHPLLLFLHADTLLPDGYDGVVRRIALREDVACGAFRLQFDDPSRAIRAIEKIANLRARRLALPYGDQALFMRAERFHRIGGFPDLPVMEDFELVRRLRRTGRIEIADEPVLSSARRWRRSGAWRTTALNQLAVLAYLGGIDPRRIARWTGRAVEQNR